IRHHLSLHSFPTRRSSDLIDNSRFIFQNIKADDFKYPLLVAPGAHVHVFDISEFGQNTTSKTSLFADLANRRLGGLFAGIDQARSEEHTSELLSLAYLVCR